MKKSDKIDTHNTNTWLLYFLAWYFNKRWQGLTCFMNPNLTTLVKWNQNPKLNKCKTGRSDDDVLDNLYRKSMAEHSNYFTPNKFSKKRWYIVVWRYLINFCVHLLTNNFRNNNYQLSEVAFWNVKTLMILIFSNEIDRSNFDM